MKGTILGALLATMGANPGTDISVPAGAPVLEINGERKGDCSVMVEPIRIDRFQEAVEKNCDPKSILSLVLKDLLVVEKAFPGIVSSLGRSGIRIFVAEFKDYGGNYCPAEATMLITPNAYVGTSHEIFHVIDHMASETGRQMLRDNPPLLDAQALIAAAGKGCTYPKTWKDPLRTMESDYEALWQGYRKSVDNGSFAFSKSAYDARWELFSQFGQSYAHADERGRAFLLSTYPGLTRFLKAIMEGLTQTT